MSDDRPRLRNIEAFPVDHEGQKFLGLRDPAGYTSSVLLLPIPAVEIVRQFDGEHSIIDIQAALMERHDELVLRQDIEEMIAALDQHGFLDSPAFAARRVEIERTFLEAPLRPATHAGGAYANDATELRQAMDRFFEPPAGPGVIASTECAPRGGPCVEAIIAPHIDFHRGGPAYAWAYRDLAERCDADVFVIFGTCHAGMRDPFALTRKDYDTPFGPARVDRELVDTIASRARQDCFASELAHRSEHSIEFQAVFLNYLYASKRDIAVVPILASFAHEAMIRRQRVEDDPRVARFLDAVGESVAASGRRVAFVAGADLAHVGPRFGDAEPLADEDLKRVADEDRRMLAAVEQGDARAFFESVTADGDRRRICGLSPIYALLRLVGKSGVVRHYGQWPDPNAVVTYASVTF